MRGAGRDIPTIPDLLVAQGKLRPHEMAVRCGSQQMTFAELDQCSNYLALRLRLLGIGPDLLAGIFLRPSTVMVAAALAILKAGGAYVPLDPGYPRDRIAYMLEDAEVPVVITDLCTAQSLPSGPWRSVVVQRDFPSAGNFQSEVPPQIATADDLAYVIYTSGSTGKPKGVEVTHRNLLNLVNWHNRAFEITPADRATQMASIGFDAAVWELWPYLSAGASVHLADEEVRISPEALRDWLVSHCITVTFVPTALAEQLIALPWPKRTPLRLMLTGADVLHRYPPAALPFALINNYGPTECTVVSTSSRVPPENGSTKTLPPIGYAIDGCRVYILDENMRRVAPGEAGEIHIGGAGVARGYRRHPELTAARFVPDPFSGDPQARLYRTGDQGRYLPDGQIAFLGRIDQLIKIRGFRIEPNEIIAALNTHPTVRESAVVARDHGGNKSLVAYVVPLAGENITATSLNSHLRALLPEYMCPSIFVRTHSLPLTPNGKTDTTALPAPDENNTIRDRSYVAPETDVEKRVSSILANVLGVPSIGRNDNFFLLGGHSLLGVHVLAKLRSTFGVEVSLKQLFETPNAAQLSAAVEHILGSRMASGTRKMA
ncbi:MAG: Peptide synthetase [Acidobacteriaceae bacterium]|nr:Peptide synthetase [Acidobacteriaceae bacterium]